MRIKEVRIKGLFGMFDHIIPLNLDTHLSIIYGINGIGKTTVFKMLEYVFNFNAEYKDTNFSYLEDISFQKIEILFEDDTTFKFIKNKEYINIFIKNETKKISTLSIFSSMETSMLPNISMKEKWAEFFLEFDEKRVTSLERIDYDTFLDKASNENLSLEDVFNKYSDRFFSTPRANWKRFNNVKELPKEHIDVIKSLNIYRIGVERLTTLVENTDSSGMTNIRKVNSIEYCTQEFSNLIKKKNTEYTDLTKSLESSLGKRILSKEINTNLDKEALKKIVFEVQKRRSELQKIGLIESLEQENLTIPDDLDSGTQAVLSVSFQDIQTKLKIFDEFYEKLTLFLDILNQRRFSFKQISVNQQDGFLITNDNGVKIELTDLSTGEQHELILLYLLLFKAPENSLILIDEPETSLHIDWQAAFLKDMEDIIKLRKFDVLISTHSPSIVSGRRELTIPLYGKKYE